MKGYIIALQFLTRIRINQKIQYDEKEFGASSYYFPLVGLTLGLILSGLFWFLNSYTNLNNFTILILVIISEVFLTGALHLDGFMDTMDGLFSGRSQERILEIMKDSRVGAHSVVAIIIFFLLKISFLLEINKELLINVFIFYPLLGRWIIMFTLAYFPYPRESGIGKYFKDNLPIKSLKYSHVFFLLMAFSLTFPRLLMPLLITLLISWFLAKYICKVIGGHTGDTYGAMNEISQLVFIIMVAILT